MQKCYSTLNGIPIEDYLRKHRIQTWTIANSAHPKRSNMHKGDGISSSKLNYVFWFMEVSNSQQMSNRYPFHITTKLCVQI